MADISRYIGPYAIVIPDWDEDAERADKIIDRKYGYDYLKLRTLHCFSYQEHALFVSGDGFEFGSGGRLYFCATPGEEPDGADVLNLDATYILDMSGRSPKDEIKQFVERNAEDLRTIEEELGKPKIGWGYVKQVG